MSRRIIFALVLLGVLLIGLSGIVLAEEEEELPIWFKLLEPLGVVIGIIALLVSYKNFKKFGGILGKSYKYIMGMIVLFIFAFIWRSLIENGLIPENLFAEIVFEAFLYIGVILVAIASGIALKGFKK